MTVLVHGLAVAGVSTVRALRQRSEQVVVSDDVITSEREAIAADLDVELRPVDDVRALLDGISTFCPSPGVPETHPLVIAAQERGIEIVSEIELAYRWEQQRQGGPRPILAVTATDGKTTTAKLTVHMLAAAGVRSIDAGNTDTPLVDAIDDDFDAFVVECSSFRLAWTPTFRADAAAWLNLQPDHLNWHRSMASYEHAKAQVFANQTAADVAIGYAADPIVMAHVEAARSRAVSFGSPTADYRLEGTDLVGPNGTIAPLSALSRRLPHDVTNALAAAALVLESGLVTGPGADAAIEAALGSFVGPPHRLELVATIDGVDWFNDSKATTPHAATAAIRSFERIVLIAGGADKGVDLSSMAAEPERFAGVIAIGSTADKIVDTFAQVDRVESVGTIDRAVELAAQWARAGDTVLLSPGCASLDQFSNFEVRGETFRRLVQEVSR